MAAEGPPRPPEKKKDDDEDLPSYLSLVAKKAVEKGPPSPDPEVEKKSKEKRSGFFAIAGGKSKESEEKSQGESEEPVVVEKPPAAQPQAEASPPDSTEAATETDTESDVPPNPEDLSDPEVSVAQQVKAGERLEQIEAEPVSEDNTTQASNLAAQKVMQGVAVEGKSPQESYEAAAADMGIEGEELQKLEAQTAAEDPAIEAATAEDEPHELGAEEVILDRTAAEEEPSEPAERVEAEEPPGATIIPFPMDRIRPPEPEPEAEAEPVAATGGPGGPGGGPPHEPTPQGGPGEGHTPAHGHGPEAIPVPVPIPVGRHSRERFDGRPSALAAAAAGGTLGYLLGRRHGRIKSKQQFEKVKKNLERKLANVDWELQEKEKKIRRLAAAKVKNDGPAVVEVMAAKVAQSKVEKPEPTTRPVEGLRPIATERIRAPEANQLHGKAPPERIGQVLVAAEAPLLAGRVEKSRPELTKPNVAETAKLNTELSGALLTERRVETLNRVELLNLSEKITVDGTSLRQIYETHLVGERGLRRLVAEHLRGGDLKKALRREIVEHEIDFERDPAMRDMATPGAAAVGGGSAAGGAAALNKMLEKATANLPTDQEGTAYQARQVLEQHQQQQKQRRVVDISMGLIIFLLTVFVVFLIVTRS